MTQHPLPFQPLGDAHRLPQHTVNRDLAIRDERLSDDHLRGEAVKAAILVVELRRTQLARAEQLLKRFVEHG
jgi:hypothetical protein